MKRFRSLILFGAILLLWVDICLFFGLVSTGVEERSSGSSVRYAQVGSITSLTRQGFVFIAVFASATTVTSLGGLAWFYRTRR